MVKEHTRTYSGTGFLENRVYKGQIKNGRPHGKGETIVWKNRLKMIGVFKRGKPWKTNLFNSKGKKVGLWLNGVKQ